MKSLSEIFAGLARKFNKDTFVYSLPRLAENDSPRLPKPRNARLVVNVDEDRKDIEIRGNREGLLYFAQFFLAMGLMEDKVDGLHIHISKDFDELNSADYEFTVINESFYRQGRP